MNMVTHEISAFLKVDLETALKVQELLEQEWFDFSECTAASLKRNAKRIFKEMNS